MSNRHARRSAKHRPTDVHAGNVPRRTATPKPAPDQGIPLPALLAFALKKLGAVGDRALHMTTRDMAEMEALGVHLMVDRHPQGGFVAKAMATKDAPRIQLATTVPEMSPAMAKALGQGGG